MSSIASYVQANAVQQSNARFAQVPTEEAGQYTVGDYDPEQPQAISPDSPGSGKKFRLQLSQRLHYAAVLAFISFLVLLVSFASPYWLSSYKFSDSAFKRLGLWDFCFQDYRHPAYQYDTKFTGCHWIYSPVYTNIRDWLQPPWFMFVQAVMTIAVCVASLGLLTVSVMFMHFLIQYQLVILCTTLLCHMLTTLLVFFALLVFYFKAFDRSWIMYPDYNHVDWSFFFAMVAAFGNGYASYLYYQEIRVLKVRMAKMKRLIVATNERRSNAGMNEVDSVYALYGARNASKHSMDGAARQGAQRGPNGNTVFPFFSEI